MTYETIIVAIVVLFTNLYVLRVNNPMLKIFVGLLSGVIAFLATDLPVFPFFNLLLAVVAIVNLVTATKK